MDRIITTIKTEFLPLGKYIEYLKQIGASS